MFYQIYNQKILSIFLFGLISLLLIILLGGCAPKPVIELGGRISIQGQELCDEAIDFYKKINNLPLKDDENSFAFRKIVCPPDSLVNLYLEEEANKPLDSVIKIRIETYENFKQMFILLGKLSDGNYGEDFSKSTEKLIASLKEIEKIEPFVSERENYITASISVCEWLIENQQVKEIKKYNEKIMVLMQGLEKLWVSDKNHWLEMLDNSLENHKLALQSILKSGSPEDFFDLDLLRQQTSEPFPKEKLAALYIINIYKDYEEEVNTMKKQMNAVESGFNLLEQAQKKLSEKEPSVSDIIYILNKIDSILEELRKDKN